MAKTCVLWRTIYTAFFFCTFIHHHQPASQQQLLFQQHILFLLTTCSLLYYPREKTLSVGAFRHFIQHHQSIEMLWDLSAYIVYISIIKSSISIMQKPSSYNSLAAIGQNILWTFYFYPPFKKPSKVYW